MKKRLTAVAIAAAGCMAIPGTALADNTPASVASSMNAAVTARGASPAVSGNSFAEILSTGAVLSRDGAGNGVVMSSDAQGSSTLVGNTAVWSGSNYSIGEQLTAGGYRGLVYLDNSSAPSSYSWTFGGDAQSLQLEPDGSVQVQDGDGDVLQTIAAPWASDANGAAVPTQFSVNGTTLTETIAAADASVYPIVADPDLGVDPRPIFKLPIPDPGKFLGRLVGIGNAVECVKNVAQGHAFGGLISCGSAILGLFDF